MDDLDEFLYGEEDKGGQVEAGNEGSIETMEEDQQDNAEDNNNNNDNDDDDDEEESEDELEIVLDESGNDIQGAQTQEKRGALQLKPTTERGDGDAQDTANEKVLDEVVPLNGHININGIGEYEGKSILEIDIDTIDDKPWRKPGADITDYFNYGFHENTWRAYCIKQKQMREEQSLKKMAYEMPDISAYQNYDRRHSKRDRSRSPFGSSRRDRSRSPKPRKITVEGCVNVDKSREPSSESYYRRRDSSRDRRSSHRESRRESSRDRDRRRDTRDSRDSRDRRRY